MQAHGQVEDVDQKNFPEPQRHEDSLHGRPWKCQQLGNLLQLIEEDRWPNAVLELCPEGPKLSLLRIVKSLEELMGTGSTLGEISEDLCIMPKLG